MLKEQQPEETLKILSLLALIEISDLAIETLGAYINTSNGYSSRLTFSHRFLVLRRYSWSTVEYIYIKNKFLVLKT